jgi:hypothetical protein
MPAYVITPSLGRIGETVDATLCDLNAAGSPDRGTDVPVRVRRTSERVLCVDDEPCRIIWGVGENGAVTFLVDGGKSIRNRERRVALAQASGLLQQLRSSLMPLAAESAEPELVAETLQLLFDWIVRERKRATVAEGACDDRAQ